MEKIAVLGPKGTFSDSAAMKYIETLKNKPEEVYYSSIDEAFHSIGKECDCAVIPVENTLDGFVQRTLDLLLELNCYIVEELSVPVQFSLIANVNSIDEIDTLYVQFKANGQCRKFIDKLTGIHIITTDSNMDSFNKVEGGKIGTAAIVPRHTLEKSKCSFKIDNVTDSLNNVTRFLVVRPGEPLIDIKENKNLKASLYIIPDIDQPGILFRILEDFYKNNINLVAIMSRPTKMGLGTYNFYIEIDANSKQKNVIIETLDKISIKYKVKILGFYSM